MPPAIVPLAEPSRTAAGPVSRAGGDEPSAVPAPRVDRLDPERLHPALWRGHQLGRHAEQGCATGYAALDAQLPGGGWPRRALSELLLAHPGIGEIRLLAPALAAVQQAGRLVMLFDPPAVLSGWALAGMGLDVEQLLVVQAASQVPVDPGATPPGPSRQVGVQARLWALEQALKSGHVGAVLAWLPPRLAPDRVRRLQLAAQAHDGPAFVLREASAQSLPSASPLRLGLRAAGVDQLAVNVLKRRGPPLLQPLHLRLPAMLSAVAARRARSAGPTEEREVRPVDVPMGAEQGAEAGSGSVTPRLSSATFVNLA
jgi:protein ImuA